MKRSAIDRITLDVHEQFVELQAEIDRYLQETISLSVIRVTMPEHVSTLLLGRARTLLDTLINYLMEDVGTRIQEMPIEAQNGFYELELREKISDSSALEPDSLKLSPDRRMAAGAVTGGMVFAASSAVALLSRGNLEERIVAGLVSLAAAGASFLVVYKKAEGIASKQLAQDVRDYLSRAEVEVLEWLTSVEGGFIEAFEEFQRQWSDNADVGEQ